MIRLHKDIKMVASSNKHDIIFSQLREDKELSKQTLPCLKRQEYFFDSMPIDEDNFNLMVRRKKAMQMVEGYLSTLVHLGEYFENNNRPLLLGQFILNEHTVFVYYDWDSNKIISWFNNPTFNKEKLLLINEECLAKGHTPMSYESYNY